LLILAGGTRRRASNFSEAMADQNSSPEAAAGLEIAVEGASVVLRAAGGPELRLSAQAAERAAERLWEAAGQAGAESAGDASRPRPPFPPYELVSPHGAG
jgi:hypothetical protein